MKIVTNSVLTIELDSSDDRDFLDALKKISRRDKITLKKALDCVAENFFSQGGEPPVLQRRKQAISRADTKRGKPTR